MLSGMVPHTTWLTKPFTTEPLAKSHSTLPSLNLFQLIQFCLLLATTSYPSSMDVPFPTCTLSRTALVHAVVARQHQTGRRYLGGPAYRGQLARQVRVGCQSRTRLGHSSEQGLQGVRLGQRLELFLFERRLASLRAHGADMSFLFFALLLFSSYRYCTCTQACTGSATQTLYI